MSIELTAEVHIVLVACVKSKGTRPAAAKDLYISALFRKERAYAERAGVPWFILSAEHGLVAPDEWLAPYERYLADTTGCYRSVSTRNRESGYTHLGRKLMSSRSVRL